MSTGHDMGIELGEEIVAWYTMMSPSMTYHVVDQDDPRWDLIGPRALGMKAVIIDRRGFVRGMERIRTLYAVLDLIMV